MNPFRIEDLSAYRDSYRAARPFPHVVLDDFLEETALRAVIDCYPSYDDSRKMGKEFRGFSEHGKVGVTDSNEFPEPVMAVANALHSPSWLRAMTQLTGIEELLADRSWQGGGMHLMEPGSHLDVHVDYNMTETGLHRRLNILLFLNEDWGDDWGGELELWNADVSECVQRISPRANRCVIFTTSETSYHGVAKLRCPPDRQRQSFAAYYHTVSAPPGFDGTGHGTMFRARPNEHLKRNLLMPLERGAKKLLSPLRRKK